MKQKTEGIRNKIPTSDQHTKPIQADGWPEAYCKLVSGGEMDRYFDRLFSPDGEVFSEHAVYWIALCMVDSDGTRMFDPDDPFDVDYLQSLPDDLTEDVVREILQHNNVLQEAD